MGSRARVRSMAGRVATFPRPRPEPAPGPEAEALADRVAAAVGGDARTETGAVRWTVFGHSDLRIAGGTSSATKTSAVWCSPKAGDRWGARSVGTGNRSAVPGRTGGVTPGDACL